MDPLAEAGLSVLVVGGRIAPDWLPGIRLIRAGGDQAPSALTRHAPQLVLLDIDDWSAELARQLDAMGGHGPELVVVADDSQADAVGALLDRRIAGFLAPDTGAADARTVLDPIRARLRRTAVVGDVGLGRELTDPLALLQRDAERVARALADLAASRAADAPPSRPVTAARIRAHIKARRLRERFFGPDLFADPAWDMLLDLAAARLEQKPVSVSSLCIAAAVPTTTALRWIKQMIDRGMLCRDADPHDARRAFIRLAGPTADAMDNCLDAMLNLPGQ